MIVDVEAIVGTENKRRYERYPVALVVTFEWQGAAIEARSRDISLGGMFIECATLVPYGAEITASVRLPALTEIAAIPCTVRWSGGAGMGLQFGALRARETWAINQLCK